MNPIERMRLNLIEESEEGVFDTLEEYILSFLSEGESDKCECDDDVKDIENDDEEEV